MKALRIGLGLLAAGALSSCTIEPHVLSGTSSFHVEITKVNGAAPPTADAPLPANHGDKLEAWEFTIDARSPEGDPTSFDGLVRLSVRPGAVQKIESTGAVGRNVLLVDGKATGIVYVTAVYGPTRLWVEDRGYVPAPIGKTPACADGKDDDGDKLIDYPADPGCELADDDSEEGGTFEAGVSHPVEYALPTIADVQGEGSTSPYPFEGMQLNTSAPRTVVVTRVASDGFYVTDLADQDKGYNSIFAFNFSLPPGMRVCDRVRYLAGTVNEFFGFTELGFPSYDLDYVYKPEDCLVPEPRVLDAKTIVDPVFMEKVESGLVRVEAVTIAKKFGPGKVKNNAPTADASSCDLNDDGTVDFTSQEEGSCSSVCDADPDCSEWTAFQSRGNYKVKLGGQMIQINTGTIPEFDPRAHRGETLDAVTGTLRNFSGGNLNWTIETRCPDDLVCQTEGCGAKAPISSQQACVRLRTLNDNDQGTN